MSFWTDLRDTAVDIGEAILAPIVAIPKFGIDILSGKNVLQSGGDYFAQLTDVKKIAVANKLTNYNLQKLPLVGDTAKYATDYTENGTGLSNYLKNYGVNAATVVGAGIAGAPGALVGQSVGSSLKSGNIKGAAGSLLGATGITDGFDEYTKNLDDFKNLIPSYSQSGGASVSPAAPIFPGAQASIDTKKFNTALFAAIAIAGIYLYLKGRK